MIAVAGPPVVAAALLPLREATRSVNVALLLVLVVLFAAILGERRGGAIAALSAALSFDYFFTHPYYSLRLARGDDIETTVLLLVVGLVTGELVVRARRGRLAALVSGREIERMRRLAEVGAGSDAPGRLIDGCAGNWRTVPGRTGVVRAAAVPDAAAADHARPRRRAVRRPGARGARPVSLATRRAARLWRRGREGPFRPRSSRDRRSGWTCRPRRVPPRWALPTSSAPRSRHGRSGTFGDGSWIAAHLSRRRPRCGQDLRHAERGLAACQPRDRRRGRVGRDARTIQHRGADPRPRGDPPGADRLSGNHVRGDGPRRDPGAQARGRAGRRARAHQCSGLTPRSAGRTSRSCSTPASRSSRP